MTSLWFAAFLGLCAAEALAVATIAVIAYWLWCDVMGR